MPTKLDLFLNGDPKSLSDKRKNGHKSEGEHSTHNSMMGGSWSIDDDELDEFYAAYCDYIRNHGPHYITEKSTRIGAMRVDLDFLYNGVRDTHLHTEDQVCRFVAALMTEAKRYVQMKDTVEIVVSEKSEPTINHVKNQSKSGVHVVIPTIKTNRYVEEAIRRTLLPRMPEFFPDLPLVDDWRKVYDPSPLTHTSNWTLLGSKKKEGTPYQIKYTLAWDTVSGAYTVNHDVPQAITPELIRKLSVRSAPNEETPLSEEGKKLVDDLSRPQDDVRISGGRAVQPQRGRPATRTENPPSRGSSPDRTIYMQPLSEGLLKYYSDHVFNLKSERYTDYKEWMDVCICLKNIHPDLESVFLEFSAQYPNYNQREVVAKWNSVGFRSDGQRLGIGSLRMWSKLDNPEHYLEIEKTNVARLVEEAAKSGTEHDVAQVVYAMYRDEFKCAKYGANAWYHYVGHIWRETDKGIGLQCKLSSDVYKEFLRPQIAALRERDMFDCSCPPKGEKNPNCEACKAERTANEYAAMLIKLKTSRFKENVMKECRELFLDESLALKLDENKNLIAFNNGVFDTLTLEFRAGRPEDYISFCTNIDYADDTQFPCWVEMETFLKSILPNERVRKYFLRHLATCLSGGNEAQKFHILTGSGSNGKSMLMNLMSTAFGDYACKAPISLLTQQRNKSAAAAPELVRMKGRRFVTMQEPDEQVPLNTGLMKELASCEKITARDLYAGSKQMIDFDIQARFHLACNEKPKVNTNDGGTWRRLVVIDFPSKFVHEPKLPNELPIDESIVQKVVSTEWATCFMAYLVHLYKEGNGFRKLSPPEEVMAYTNEYKKESDVIARFLDEFVHKVEITEGDPEQLIDATTWTTITTTFQEWKRNNELGSRGSSATELKKRLETLYGKCSRNGWTAFRFGNA